MSSKVKDEMTKMPDDAKTMIVSTFVKSFNSMPKLLRWGTIIAVIVGIFYFTVVQKYVAEVKEKSQVEVIQTNVNNLNEKIKIIEEDYKDAFEVYQDLGDLQEMFALSNEMERKKVKNFMNFIKKTHSSKEYYEAVNYFEKKDLELQNEYQEMIEEIFDRRIQKRMKDRRKTYQDLDK